MIRKELNLANGTEAIAALGEDRVFYATKVTRVGLWNIPCEGTYPTPWGDPLEASPETHFGIFQEVNSEDRYPILKSEFHGTYRLDEFDGQTAWFLKVVPNKMIQVPEGVICFIDTEEGPNVVYPGEYISIGKKDELYRITPDSYATGYVEIDS